MGLPKKSRPDFSWDLIQLHTAIVFLKIDVFCLPMKKLSLPDWLSRLGIWIVPLISVSSLPLLLSGWQSSDRASISPAPTKPAPSQINPAASPSLVTPPAQISAAQPTTAAAAPSSLPQPQTLVSPHPQSPPVAQKPATPHPATHSASVSKTKTLSSRHSHHHSHQAVAKHYTPPPLEIRVAILRDEPTTTIATSQQATLRDRNGKLLTQLSGNQGVSVQPQSSALVIDGKSYPGVVWVQPTAGSAIYVGDRWYRGKVLLVSEGSALMAVNYVSLEHYLYSVVGSEMHATAPAEALKAQAIAARSYALVHMIRPASDWFDLGNTQRWQVYKGLNSEFNTTQQAVTATSGQILSYSGGVVESLYAATDEIVSRAHGGRGMSQTGAYDLAQQGYDYQRILARYYPGVGLARLIVK